jgi:hypothetical protein
MGSLKPTERIPAARKGWVRANKCWLRVTEEWHDADQFAVYRTKAGFIIDSANNRLNKNWGDPPGTIGPYKTLKEAQIAVEMFVLLDEDPTGKERNDASHSG